MVTSTNKCCSSLFFLHSDLQPILAYEACTCEAVCSIITEAYDLWGVVDSTSEWEPSSLSSISCNYIAIHMLIIGKRMM